MSADGEPKEIYARWLERGAKLAFAFALVALALYVSGVLPPLVPLRAVIQALACHFCVSIESIELAYLVDFKSHFAAELKELRRLQAEGLVDVTDDWITVTPRGRLLVRVVCMVFDRYLREARARATYSKVI
jgi:hypothetical protein